VRHQLAGLVDRAGEAGPQHDGIEASLEVGDQVVAGASALLGRGRECGPQLPLGDVVLGAQALLLLQPPGVLGEHMTVATVDSRPVRTLTENLRALRGQGDAEGSAQ